MEMTMVPSSEEASEVGSEWEKASSSAERSEMGSVEVLASRQELESVESSGEESGSVRVEAMEAKRALKKEQEWEEASGKETAKELEQAWGLVRAPTSAPSKEQTSMCCNNIS